jgi:ferritin heavy chain
MSGSNTDKVQENLKKFSGENIDSYFQISTFTDEIHEVLCRFYISPCNKDSQRQAIRGHIYTEYKAWFFFRKFGANCLRSNVSLHGFAA